MTRLFKVNVFQVWCLRFIKAHDCRGCFNHITKLWKKITLTPFCAISKQTKTKPNHWVRSKIPGGNALLVYYSENIQQCHLFTVYMFTYNETVTITTFELYKWHVWNTSEKELWQLLTYRCSGKIMLNSCI